MQGHKDKLKDCYKILILGSLIVNILLSKYIIKIQEIYLFCENV